MPLMKPTMKLRWKQVPHTEKDFDLHSFPTMTGNFILQQYWSYLDFDKGEWIDIEFEFIEKP